MPVKHQRGREHVSSKAARAKNTEVTRRASARRKKAEAEGQPFPQARSSEELLAAAQALLRKHHIKNTPATERVAKIHEQMNDAIDALYETAVRGGKEQRQVSAMVSAGKLAIATLNMLGLPGDEIEDEEAAAAEAAAEDATMAKRAKKSKVKVAEDDDEDEDDKELAKYEQ